MNIRPDAFRRAFRSPPVILALLALLGAVTAVLIVRPEEVTARPFELPAIEEQVLNEEEVRLITFDRFNLEIPLRQTLALPPDEPGRIRVITAAVREQLSGEGGAWPAALPLPLIYLVDSSGEQLVVVDLAVSAAGEFPVADQLRVRTSLERTLNEAGFERVVLLQDGEETPPEQGISEEAD